MFDQRWSEDRPIEGVVHQIIGAVTNNEFRRLRQLLRDFPDLDLVDILSPSLETLLHLACSNASQSIVEMIVEYFQNSPKKTTKLEDFINMRNSEGFASVHLASFAGKQQIIEYLHQKGADLTLANVAGLTAMHTASQGDQVTVMCYLRIAGLSIDQKDQNGRTPLHWAAYQSANNAAAFLLAWGAKFQEPDQDNQMTPLHYAVISGSTQIVRKLLLAGADRNPKDREGLTPIAHAITKKLDTITAILSSTSGLAEACNLRQPFEKPRKKKRLLLLFLALYLIAFLSSLFFVIPYVSSTEMFVVFLALTFITFSCFLLAWLSNPGFLELQDKNPQNLLAILKIVPEPDMICAKCEIIQPARSKHCEMCQRCVKVYDHHCPWINNCVGANNYKYFYSFLVLIFILLMFQVFMHALYFAKTDVPTNPFFIELFASQYMAEVFHLVTSIASTMICAFFLVCTGILLWVQTSNLLKGITTNEKFGFHKRTIQAKDSTVHNKHYSSLEENEKNNEIPCQEKQMDHIDKTVNPFEDEDDLKQSLVNSSQLSRSSSESISTNLDREHASMAPQNYENQSRIQNLLDICFRNNLKPDYDTKPFKTVNHSIN